METCRVCLKQSDTLLNFTVSDSERFQSITGITVTNIHDEFLCESCLDRLDIAFTFREDALKVDMNWDSLDKRETQLKFESHEVFHHEEYQIMEDHHNTTEEQNLTTSHNFYKCHFCDENFRYRKLRDQHLKETHKDAEKSISCEFSGCDKKFLTDTHVKRHIKVHHTADKFICELCAKRCSSKSTLMSHMRTHTGEKPFVCKEPNCDKAFRRGSDLYYHQSSHSDRRPHVCLDCGASYKLKSGLRNHRTQEHGVDVQKMLQCPECDRRFLFKNMLENHISIIHRGERNFVCGECSKTYSKGSHLKRHYHDNHPDFYEDFIRQELHLKRNSLKNSEIILGE